MKVSLSTWLFTLGIIVGVSINGIYQLIVQRDIWFALFPLLVGIMATYFAVKIDKQLHL